MSTLTDDGSVPKVNRQVSIITEVVYEYDDIWEALVGSDFAGLGHWVDSLNCDWRKPNDSFPIVHADKDDDEKRVTTVITQQMIVDGFKAAMKAGETHCGGEKLLSVDDLDYDACFADFVLQYAIFGEMVFG